MGYRLPGLRIDNVRDAFAIEFIVVAIAAGGADAVTIDVDNRLNGVFPVGRFLDRHPPGLAFAIHPAADQRPAHRHQIAGDPLLLHQPREVVGGIAFPHGGEVDKQIGNIFLQELPAALINNLQMLQAGARLRRGYRLGIRGGDRLFIRAKAPQVDQRPHGNIHRAVRFGANPQRQGDDIRHRFAHRPGPGIRRVVETHQRRVVFPGRQQAIVGVQLGLNLGAQRLGLCLIHANDADPPEGAHRFAIQHGGRRGGGRRSGS